MDNDGTVHDAGPFHPSSQAADPVVVPKARHAVWIERLFWVFMLSFALDYRAEETRTGAGLDQLLFLGTCMASTGGIFLLGWRSLVVRPGAWMVSFWGLFLAFMLVNSFLQGVPLGQSIRVVLPLVFCFFGIMNAHIAGCSGIPASRIINPVLTVACVNVIWRIIHGFVFKHVTMETVRIEVLSPVNDWLAAWIACAILLRGRFHWNLLVACTVLFIGIFITITRSLIFPVVTAGVAASICYALGVRWRVYEWSAFLRKLVPLGAAFLLVVFAMAMVALFEPLMIERWTERLFHDVDARNISTDISYLTRKAEADAMWKILSDDPVHFINGKGVGGSYYWDGAYLPEIWMIMPKEDLDVNDIRYAGHSIWTYSLFSGGIIALLSYIGLFIATATFSLVAARANATDPGPDQWLAFLPFVATCCLLSMSLTSNPFQERLAGIFFGVMAGLPQAFMVRSSWIHTVSRPQHRHSSA